VGKQLPALSSLSAYQKLPQVQQVLSASGNLQHVMSHVEDIRELARQLFKVSAR
jgi:hypothetical protein